MKQTESMTNLVARHRRQSIAFNRIRPLPNETWNTMADDSFRQIEKLIRRAPIRTKEDAVAALNFIERELSGVGEHRKALTPILRSLRGYIHKERVTQKP